MTKTVAVDFDGVIHQYGKGWYDGTIYDEPVPGAFEGLEKLQEQYAVFIHTTRPAPLVVEWLCQRGEGRFECVTEDTYGAETIWRLEDHVTPPAVIGQTPSVIRREKRLFWDDQKRILVTDRKLPACAYIDDRGIRFYGWSQALWSLWQYEGRG